MLAARATRRNPVLVIAFISDPKEPEQPPLEKFALKIATLIEAQKATNLGCSMPAGENPGGAQTFARNLAPGFTHYLSERLEMTPQQRGVKEGQNNKRK
jgi:hypothetical protein